MTEYIIMQFINSRDAGAWVTSALDLVQQHLSWPIIIVMFFVYSFAIFALFVIILIHKYRL